MRRFSKLGGLGIGVAVACSACSGDPSVPVAERTERAPGTVALALEVAPGLTVNRVDYVISGNGVNITGFVDLTDPNASATAVFSLAAGSGYTASLSATATNGVSCSGSSPFSVVGGATSTVFVNLLCSAVNDGDTQGGTIVNGVFVPGNPASCPDVATYTVSPRRTSAGAIVQLTGTATLPGATTYWETVPPGLGTFLVESPGRTRFVCAFSGIVPIRFVVTDGKSCFDATPPIDVDCKPADWCGNGFVDLGEECDDGNDVAGDGCTLCQIDG